MLYQFFQLILLIRFPTNWISRWWSIVIDGLFWIPVRFLHLKGDISLFGCNWLIFNEFTCLRSLVGLCYWLITIIVFFRIVLIIEDMKNWPCNLIPLGQYCFLKYESFYKERLIIFSLLFIHQNENKLFVTFLLNLMQRLWKCY